jgi:hypothetical protein
VNVVKAVLRFKKKRPMMKMPVLTPRHSDPKVSLHQDPKASLHQADTAANEERTPRSSSVPADAEQ